MAEQHYRGGCQCGAVAYEVDVDIDQALTCNCSRCKPMGFVLAFAPRNKFTLNAGEDATTEYLFNTGKIKHRFCATCGIESFAIGTGPDGSEMAAINLNCLEGVDARALSAKPVDGKSF
jgi:hypothetical protein